MQASAILLAAGKGLRLRSRISKPLVKVAGRPLILYSLSALSREGGLKDIIVVASKNNRAGITALIKKHKIKKVSRVVLGGRRRQDSVRSGLKALTQGAGLVLIHDSARPFIDSKSISSAIRSGEKNGAAVIAVRVSSTIKSVRAGLWVEKTLDRKQLWEIQTPQVFNTRLLLSAYKKYGDSEVTDDASLIEKMGKRVAVVEGSKLNIKVTSPEDLKIAGGIAKALG